LQITIFNELRMKKIRNSVYLIIFGICLCTLYSCKKETEIIDPNALGAAYYPLTIDKFWIYKVDSINYSKTIGVVVDSSSSITRKCIGADRREPRGECRGVLVFGFSDRPSSRSDKVPNRGTCDHGCTSSSRHGWLLA